MLNLLVFDNVKVVFKKKQISKN